MSREDLLEIARLRALVEADAMARAVRVYTPADMAAIEEAWQALLIRPDEDAEEIFVRHRALHQLLISPGAGNWDRRVLEMLWRAAERYVAVLIVERDLAEPPTRMRDSHRGLLDAALSRSPREARRAVRGHIDAAVELVTELLDQQQ